MYNTIVSVGSLQERHGLPLLNQIAGWIIFGASWSNQPHLVHTPLLASVDRRVVCIQDSPLFSPFARSSSPRLRGRPKGASSPIFSLSVRASSSFPSAPRAFSTCRIVRLCIFGLWSKRMRVRRRRNIEQWRRRMTMSRNPGPKGIGGV
jgi:hypothetical protein